MDIIIRTFSDGCAVDYNSGFTYTFDTNAAALLTVAKLLNVNCSLTTAPATENTEGSNLQNDRSARDKLCPKCKGSKLPALINENGCTLCKGKGKIPN